MNNDSANQAYYKQAYDKAVKELCIYSGAIDGLSDTVRALTTTLGHWVLTEYKEYVRSSCDEDLKYHEDVIVGMLSAIEFIVKVTECKNTVDFLERTIEEGRINSQTTSTQPKGHG